MTTRPIPGYKHIYQAGDDGRIYSTHTGTPRPLKPRPDKGGYLRVNVATTDGERVTRHVHRLVLEAFSGPRPNGMEARHLNHNSTDNRPTNLRWGSWQENHQDALTNGKHVATRTHCPRGHRYFPANTRLREGRHGRECMSCHQARSRLNAEPRDKELKALADKIYSQKIMNETNEVIDNAA